MAKEIPLTKGYVAIVDDEDYAQLSAHKWLARPVKTGDVYAFRTAREGGKAFGVHMHRVVCDAPEGVDVDHKNHNTLDNRRANLRPCTRSQNLANRRPMAKSGFKGVRRHKNKWVMQYNVDGTTKYGGLFDTAEEAARAFDRMARATFGEFAYLNFPAEADRVA